MFMVVCMAALAITLLLDLRRHPWGAPPPPPRRGPSRAELTTSGGWAVGAPAPRSVEVPAPRHQLGPDVQRPDVPGHDADRPVHPLEDPTDS